jgi:hypothetical protein
MQSHYRSYCDLRLNVTEPCNKTDLLTELFKVLTYLPNSCYDYISLNTFAVQRDIYKGSRQSSIGLWQIRSVHTYEGFPTSIPRRGINIYIII